MPQITEARLEINRDVIKRNVFVEVFAKVTVAPIWLESHVTFRLYAELFGQDATGDDSIAVVERQGMIRDIVEPSGYVLATGNYPLGGALNEDDSWFNRRDEVYARVSLSVGHEIADNFVNISPGGFGYIRTNTVTGYF